MFVCLSVCLSVNFFFCQRFLNNYLGFILKFGTKLDSDELYCVTKKKQPDIAYQSLYMFIFLSFQWKFLSDFSAPIGASVLKFCVHLQIGKMYCVNGN